MLKGKAFTPELLRTASEAVMNEVEPVGDFRGSAEYRREMAGVLARRALEAAWKRANK
jgi:carbon-monoxide dehydrogenase medium subunit